MNDPVPDYRNRIAFIIGRVFHPYFICVPTLFAVLDGLTLAEALRWSAIVLFILLAPGMTMVILLQRRGRMTYQRRTRGPLYATAWLSVVACLLVVQLLVGPRVLVACLIALAVWLPLQLAINSYVTKVSTHAAVVAGCATGLLLLGKLNSPWLLLVVLAIILSTVWSRVATRNHTVAQVGLGLVVGILPVVVVFPLILS